MPELRTSLSKTAQAPRMDSKRNYASYEDVTADGETPSLVFARFIVLGIAV
jgi:hypothetical protein